MNSPRPPTSPEVRSTLIGAAFLSLQPLALNALSVPAMAYIIRQLGAVGYAQWMTAVAVLTFLAVLTNLGLRSAFVRTVAADPRSAGSALAEQLGLRLTLSILAGTLAVSACLLLGYSSTVLMCAAIGTVSLVMTSIATTLGDLLQAVHRLRTLATVNLVAGLSLTLASVIVAWRDLGPVAMAAAYTVGPVTAVMLLLPITHRGVCRVRIAWLPQRFRELLVQSRFLAAHQLLFAGSAHAEALLLPRLLGMNPFGLFAAGAMLGNRLVALPDALCAAAYPVMVKAWRQGRRDARAVMLRYLTIAVGGGVVVAILITIAAAPLGRLLLPAHSDMFAFVVQVTIWSVPLIGIELVLGYALNAAGRDAIQAKLAVPAAACCLALSLGLVFAFGLQGACWSMMLRPAVRAAFLVPVAARTFGADSASGHNEMTWSIAPMKKVG